MAGNVVKLVLCLFFGIGFLISGARGLYVYLTNATPQEISCADYLANPPDAQWLTLTNCYLRVDESAHESLGGDIDKVFIPLAATEDAEGPIKLVLATDEPKWVDAFQNLENSSEESVDRILEKLPFLFEAGTFSGSIQSDDDDRDELRKVLSGVSSDAAVVEHNERPDWAFALGFTIAGLLLAGFGVQRFVVSYRRRKRVMQATTA